MTQPSLTKPINRLAFIGNYLPRQCGIATFTTDLCEAIAAEYSGIKCIAVPVNDTESGYAYPNRVRFELAEKDLDSYRRAADFLNINNVDIVCLQHEYGIFGGRAGSHVLELLRELNMPIITTLHTVLREPDHNQRHVLEQVAGLSARRQLGVDPSPGQRAARSHLDQLFTRPASLGQSQVNDGSTARIVVGCKQDRTFAATNRNSARLAGHLPWSQADGGRMHLPAGPCAV